VKKVIGWMRANWLIVLMCVVIIAAPVAFYIGASMWNKSIRTARQERALADYNKLTSAAVLYTLAPALPGEESLEVRRVPHADLTAHFKKLREQRAAQIGQVVELATERNRAGHEPIVPGLLPAPPEREGQILRLEMQDRMVGTSSSPSVLQARLDAVDAGAPLDANEIARVLEEFRQGEIEKHEAEFGTTTLTPERETELADALVKRRIGEYQRRAGEITVFASMESMPTSLPRTKTPMAPDIVDCFIWQWDTWIVEDVLRAVEKANTSEAGERLTAAEGPVKRIIKIETEMVPGIFSNGPQVAKVSGSGPLIATDPSLSITGRATHESNQLYDVRPVSVSMVVSSARIPEVLDAFSTTNLMGILDLDVSEVDLWSDLKLGYYYGDEHVVKLDLKVETIWLRSWVKEFMPETVRKLLKVKESA
jgi:hypothetical protein